MSVKKFLENRWEELMKELEGVEDPINSPLWDEYSEVSYKLYELDNPDRKNWVKGEDLP